MHKPRGVDEAATWVICVVALLAINTGLAESFRSLITWAAGHEYHGIWAYVWPFVVDSFSVVGEVAVFTSIRRDWPWQKRVVPWFSIAVGLGISVSVNVGVTAGANADWLTPATHAVAPLAAAMMLTIALSVLKSIMATEPVEATETVAETPDPTDEETPTPPPARPPVPRRAMPTASQIERVFAGHIKRNQMPSMNAVMARMHLGKPRAKAVLAHLETVMVKPAPVQAPAVPSQRELVNA